MCQSKDVVNVFLLSVYKNEPKQFKKACLATRSEALYVTTPDTFMPIDEVKVMDKMHTHIKRTPTSFSNKCQNQTKIKIRMKCERS